MRSKLKVFVSYGIVVLISLVMAINYTLFVFPNKFAPAGLNGIFTMVQYLFDFKFSYTTIIINIPLAIAAFFINSKPRALRTLTYSLCFSGFLMVFEHIDLSAFVYSSNVSALVGPAVAGLITGFCGYIMHKINACYGGTEFIAGFIHKFKPEMNFFNVIFVLNISVAILSYFVYDYKIEPVLMCIIYSFASSSVRDMINRRNESAVRCEIITDHPEELSAELIQHLHHSVTILNGKGAYTGNDKAVLLCIVNVSQVTELTHIAAQFPDSFVIVSSVTKVLGNFKRLDSHGNPEVHLYDGGVAAAKK